MSDSTDLNFVTNVQLKSIIGKDLINDDNIAILELVKNAFDADAKKVVVKYLNLKENDDDKVSSYSTSTSRLIIQDDGVGMNLEDIQNKWLNIAYSEKKTVTRQYKRMMAGAKGVGRFSCDRLGEYLILYARKKSENRYVKLIIDWKKFEVQNQQLEIQTIPLKWEYVNDNDLKEVNIKPFEHGVTLEIIKLRSTWAYPPQKNKGGWDVRKFIELKQYLEKLINPNQAFEDNDFGIFIEAPEFSKENKSLNSHDKFIGQVDNRIFDKLDFKSTSIESSTLDEGRLLYTELKDKGETIFWIKEENPYYPHIKNAKVSLFYLNPYAKAFFTRQTGIQSVNYGSIFLFINGFRIPPYGEVGNDWLGLDQRKAQGRNRFIGLREIVGQLEVLDEYNDFQIISSREGIVKNENFDKLTKQSNNDSFFFKAFRRLERYVVDGLNWDSSLYDSSDPKFKEIEKNIIDGKTNEEELEYRESDQIKKSRVYTAIHSIISVRGINVDELYINEDLIINKIDEEREKSEQEFKKLLDDFENKKIDSETLNRVLKAKSKENQELVKQLKDFKKYSTDDATSKAILELQNYKGRLEEQEKIIRSLKEQLEELKSKKKEAEKAVEEKELELDAERQKNAYLLATRRILSEDADGLIHTIKINNIEIRDGIDNLIDDLMYSNFDKDRGIERLANLKVNAERSLKLAEIATRSDFSEDIENRSIDIIQYCKEYIDIYGSTFTSEDDLVFEFEANKLELIRKVSVLNLSIVLDNLISNAIKWNATKIIFRFETNPDGTISLNISDNGKGLSKKFLKNPEKIFELGVREPAPNGYGGSGIGLNYTRKLMREMGGDIMFVGNGLGLSGASFKVTFK
jgi:signal transduction histidine kinase